MNSSTFQPSVHEIHDIFAKQVTRFGGEIVESSAVDDRLYCRAIMDLSRDIVPGDTMDHGVALRVFDEQVLIHPYTFRRVCRNGAITARCAGSVQLVRGDNDYDRQQCLEKVTASIELLTGEETFNSVLLEMRDAIDISFDSMINVVSVLGTRNSSMKDAIISQFLDYEPQTGYGLMNAITAVARQQRNPETKWRLEEFGGGIPALLKQDPQLLSPVVRRGKVLA